MQKIRKREVFELKKRQNWGKKIGKHFFLSLIPKGISEKLDF